MFPEIAYCIRYEGELRQSGRVIKREDGKNFLPLGTFAFNCEPKGVWLPDQSVDPVLYDGGRGPVSLSEELRTVFSSGGFPFWAHMFRRRAFVSPLGFSPKYPELREALRKDLVEIENWWRLCRCLTCN